MALLDIRGHIEFIYFDDLHAACDFFGNVLGLPLVCDQGWSKIYRTSPTSYLGAVDRSQGACKATTRDGVLTSLVINTSTRCISVWSMQAFNLISGRITASP